MKHFAQIIALAAVLAIAAVPAFTHDDNNALGIYFDEAATENEIWCDVPGQVTGYLILTSPTVATIDEWWLAIEFGTTVHSYSLAGNGVNRMTSSDPFVTMFYVELAVPLPCAGATILATLDVGVDGTNPTACLVITTHDGQYGDQPSNMPGALAGDERIFFWPSVGVPNYPIVFPTCVATINREAPVMSENRTWSDTKALFE